MRGRIRNIDDGKGLIETLCGATYPFRTEELDRTAGLSAGSFVEFEVDEAGRALKVGKMKDDDITPMLPVLIAAGVV